MGSLSFKASIKKLWCLLRGRKDAASAAAKSVNTLFFQDREMAMELRTFESGAAPLAYTSLRDLLPRGAAAHRRSRSWDGTPFGLHHNQSGILSQQAPNGQHHISWYGERPAIRNNLVELAARAYLQPTIVPREQPTQFLQRLWMKLTTPAAAMPQPHPAPQPGVGIAALFPSWMRVPFNFSPSLAWIFRQLRPQSTALLRN